MALIAVGVIGGGYVLTRAAGGPGESGLERLAVGHMSELVVLADPPPQPTRIFADADGAQARLSDFHGRIAVINLWATWCAPCVREMPSLDRLAAQVDPERVLVVPVSFDRTRSEAAEFYEEFELAHLPLYHDNTLGLGADVGAIGLPTTVIYGPDGAELARVTRDAEWDSPEAFAVIDALVAQVFAAEGAQS